MKILCIVQNDWAGVCYGLSQAVNRETDHEMRVMCKNPHKYGYAQDMFELKELKGFYQEILDDSDVVLTGQSQIEYIPYNIPIPDDKIKCIWHGGSRYRTNFKFFNRSVHPMFDKVYALHGLVGLDRNNILLDQPFDTARYGYVVKDPNKFVVCHSPSNEKKKGTKHFIKAMSRLKKVIPSFEPNLIMDRTAKECLDLKRECHVFFDQIAGFDIPYEAGAIHGHGLSLVESASFGAVCLNGGASNNEPIFRVTNDDDIYNVCLDLYRDRDKLEIISRSTREWVEKAHSYKAVANQFIKPLEDLI